MRDFKERVSDINAALELWKAPPWVSSFEFRPFGVDTYGALWKGSQYIIHQLTEERAERSSMSFGLCKRIAPESLSVEFHRAISLIIKPRRRAKHPRRYYRVTIVGVVADIESKR